jgi:hypothetical protein
MAFLVITQQEEKPTRRSAAKERLLLLNRVPRVRTMLLRFGLIRHFATEPQPFGRRLAGATPEEAWQSMAGAEPRKLLPPSLQYLLGTQSTIITVTHEGVRLRLGAIDRWYSGNPRLSGLSGEKLIVRFNQDVPQWIVATHPPSDPKATAPFIIEASPYLPAMAASKGELRKAGRQRNLFHNFGRAIHREILRHGHLIPILEPTIVPELNNSGESINAEDAPRMPSRIRTF